MALSLRSMASQSILSGALRQTTLGQFRTASPSFLIRGFLAQLLPTSLLPWISIQLPTLGSIWDSILKAVPKKKTSHRKKRQRFLAGKALKDVTSLNKCSGCGNVKKAHHLCPYCVREIKDMWNGRGTVEVEAQRKEAREEAMKDWLTVPQRREANRETRR
ncbi:MAG: hypothetical protein GOMPHAMPRED_006257 [Gomphillus americanus]|uniref:Large ribosomal subunit protein bL32m n=1 Tax=Gomphillus americanus TaxID=1940652 RepID=A0A8H3EQK0_9LECA|nr:MAG: hypothetical protein GOMPHAMPRED_006257 [Gomphillus americanus]